MEGRVAGKMSQEFSRTLSRILGPLSKLDDILMSPQIWILPGTVPRTSRKTGVENQEPTGDRSQTYPYPEVEFSIYESRNSNDSDPEEDFDSTKRFATKCQGEKIIKFSGVFKLFSYNRSSGD